MTEYIVNDEDFDMIPDVGPDWVRRRASTLVRCKDCNYFDKSFCNGFGEGQYVPPNGFCFEGERKK